MATVPDITIKGTLTFTPEGSAEPIDCGEVTFELKTNAKPFATGGPIPRGGWAGIVPAAAGSPDYVISNAAALPAGIAARIAERQVIINEGLRGSK